MRVGSEVTLVLFEIVFKMNAVQTIDYFDNSPTFNGLDCIHSNRIWSACSGIETKSLLIDTPDQTH